MLAGYNHVLHALERTWHHARISYEISFEFVDAEAILSALRQEDLIIETLFSWKQFVEGWIRSEFYLIPIGILCL